MTYLLQSKHPITPAGFRELQMRCVNRSVTLQTFDFEYVLNIKRRPVVPDGFCEMLDNHKETGADISIATIPVAKREASEFGILKVRREEHDYFFY
ncbi:MAG: hypothetical protein WKG06_24520 [Segetibacter sp.]